MVTFRFLWMTLHMSKKSLLKRWCILSYCRLRPTLELLCLFSCNVNDNPNKLHITLIVTIHQSCQLFSWLFGRICLPRPFQCDFLSFWLSEWDQSNFDLLWQLMSYFLQTESEIYRSSFSSPRQVVSTATKILLFCQAFHFIEMRYG